MLLNSKSQAERVSKDLSPANDATERSHKQIRVAIVSTSIAPYAIPEGQRLAGMPELETRHFFARKKEPGRQWKVPDVPFPYEILAGLAVRLNGWILYLPLMLPYRLFKFRPDVIISGQLGMLTLFTYLYAIPAQVPVLIGWEGTPHTEACRSTGLRKWLRRLIGSLARGFLCYSPSAELYLRSIGARGPFFPVPSSVDESKFTPPGGAREENVLLFVGGLIQRKGVELLIPIFLEVLRREPKAQLWIVGDGPLKSKLMHMLPANSKEHVTWFGFLDQQETICLYRRASIFVFPTLLDFTPLVLVEAVMCGLPIATTPFAGNSELLVQEGKNGFIADPRDTKSFARAILDVLHSPNKQEMYRTSLMLAEQYTPEHTANHFLTGILKVLNRLPA